MLNSMISELAPESPGGAPTDTWGKNVNANLKCSVLKM